MTWHFSISSTLTIIITVILITSILFVTSISYVETEKKLHESFEREKKGSEDIFNQSSIYIHRGLKLWDSTYNSDLQNMLQVYLDAYNLSNGHPELIPLNKMKQGFPADARDKVDLYLINTSGTIVFTTYQSEKGYNFSSFSSFFDDLNTIRMQDSFVPDEIVRGVLPGAPLRKFLYHSSPDHLYVAQISLNVQNDSVDQRSKLSYAQLISYVLNQNSDLKQLHLFNSFAGVTIGKRDYPLGVDNATRSIVKRVLMTHNKEEWPDPGNHTISSYVFIPHDVDISPSSKYQNLVGKFVFSTKRIEGEIGYTLFLHVLLALFASVIAILIAWILSRRITIPINQIVKEIDEIAAGNIYREITPSPHTDLDRISDAVRIMMSQIRRSISDLEASETRYRELFRSSSDSVFIVRDSIIIDANPSAAKLFSFVSENPVGHDITEICPGITLMQKAGSEEIFSGSGQQGIPHEEDITISVPGGTQKVLNVTQNHVNIAGEGLVQVLIRDITKRYEVEEAMKNMTMYLEQEIMKRTQVLQATVQELDSFTYTVSHDLRGPLRAIDGYAHLMESLKDKNQGGGVKQYLAKIHDNIRKMSHLIDDLLRLSRTSRQPLVMSDVDMTDLVQDVVHELTSHGMYPDVEIEVRDLPPIKGDAALVRQVFVNLISNAIKFRKQDQRHRIIIYSQKDEDPVIFAVQDSGIGFDMQYGEVIFDVFRQLHPDNTFEGTGVGLAIVKKIILRHGGSIRVVSEKGVGTTFFFTFSGKTDFEDKDSPSL